MGSLLGRLPDLRDGRGRVALIGDLAADRLAASYQHQRDGPARPVRDGVVDQLRDDRQQVDEGLRRDRVRKTPADRIPRATPGASVGREDDAELARVFGGAGTGDLQKVPGAAARRWGGLVGLTENRYDPGGAARDHAAGVGGELLAERDAAHRDAELAHRLLGRRVLAPGSLDEAAGLGVVAREELAKLLESRHVVVGALAQPPAGLLEVTGLHVAEHSGHGFGRPVAGDPLALQLCVVAAGHGDHALLDVPLAELDHDRGALADPLPALLRRLAVAGIHLGA